MIKLFLIQNTKNILVGIFLLLGLVVLYVNYYPKPGNKTASDNSTTICNCKKEVKTYFIEVMGQVVNPGVYEIDSDRLVIEAIEMAGGYSTNADLAFVHKNISLSSFIKPTQKVYIPAINEDYMHNTLGLMELVSGKINLNSADKTTLMTISGVGEVTASKIIEIRPIKSMEDLNNLVNVPKKTIDNIIAKSEL